MSYFESGNVKVFPTAYRQYDDSGETKILQGTETSRLNTEYNITNLVNGLLDNDINNGSFVVSSSISGNYRVIKFCMQGYYFELNNVDANLKPLYVKVNINDTDVNYGSELKPINYSSGDSRDLDKIDDSGDTPVINFIGLDYVTESTQGYFQLLDATGNIPEKSKLRFSTNQIGYLDGSSWVSIGTKFKTNTLEVNTSFKSQNIVEDTSSSFKIKGVNNGSQTNQAIYVNNSGVIVSGSHASTKSITTGTFNVMDSVTMNSDGSLASVGTKTLPVDTSSLTNDNAHLPTSALVKSVTDTLQTNINNEATARGNADTTLQTNINNEATARANADNALSGRITTNADNISSLNTNKISTGDLIFEFANGELKITKSY